VHVLEPRFTFHGFRYCEVSGDLTVQHVEAVAVHSDLARTAWFACSDDSLNKLHENVVWGQRSNFLSVPTDCPQRDERLGWTGDIQVFAATASRLHDCRGFLADWLGDLRLEQHENGSVPVVIPDVLSAAESGIAGWGDAAVVVPWQVAVRSGDLQVLRDSLESMRRWVDWIAGQLEDGLWMSDLQLGDWLDPDAPAEHPHLGKTDRKLVANATFVHSLRLTAQALDLCGEDGSRYHQLADETGRKAWARWGEEARTTQTGCALSLRFGLVPQVDRHEVGEALASLVRENGGRIGTGFLGTPEVLYALSDTGQLDAAYQLLTCRDCPSWLYQVDQGATTMWERWDAITPDGSVNAVQLARGDDGMLSFNHYAYGAVAAWMHDVLAGLRVSELPTPELVIAPRPGGGVTWAEASLQTPRGLASVRWDLTDVLTVKAVVPPGYAATFHPPGGEPTALEPGEHTFSC
jgi:alpha-L-rhamnosidase